MNSINPSSAEFFEAKYRAAPDADPWHFASAEYELRRYEAVIRALEGRRYVQAFEPGCSVGVLTERLARICHAVDACDFSQTAAAAARQRCADWPRVEVRCAALTGDEPWGDYDLVVLCEIGYYFTPAAWAALVNRMARTLHPGAVVLACHWLGHSSDHMQSGDDVHAAMRHPLLQEMWRERHKEFRLERWMRKA